MTVARTEDSSQWSVTFSQQSFMDAKGGGLEQRKQGEQTAKSDTSVDAAGLERSGSLSERIAEALARWKRTENTVRYFALLSVLVLVLLCVPRPGYWASKPEVHREGEKVITVSRGIAEQLIAQKAMAYTLNRPQFLLFGDSLTERGFAPGGWAAGLAHHFQRRVDVINRGFGGYNTRWALHIAPDVLADTTAQNTRLVTLFFGANDAARPEGPSEKQHVPVKEYTQNLKSLVETITSKGVKRVVLITPPPVHDKGRKDWQVVKVGAEAAANLTLDRTLEYTEQYARAVQAVGKEMSLPVVNLYDTMQEAENWGLLFFVDGLHFTPDGNRFAFQQILATIQAEYPDMKPELLPVHLPPWDAINDTLLSSLPETRKQGAFAEVKLPEQFWPASASTNTNSTKG